MIRVNVQTCYELSACFQLCNKCHETRFNISLVNLSHMTMIISATVQSHLHTEYYSVLIKQYHAVCSLYLVAGDLRP